MTIRTEPSTDPVGTVRRDQQGRLYVRTDEAPPAFWVVISGPPLQPLWRTPGSLADTVIVGAVPGTPASATAEPDRDRAQRIIEQIKAAVAECDLKWQRHVDAREQILRDLATQAYEYGLVSSIGMTDHTDTLRAALAKAQQDIARLHAELARTIPDDAAEQVAAWTCAEPATDPALPCTPTSHTFPTVTFTIGTPTTLTSDTPPVRCRCGGMTFGMGEVARG